jgi:hypothetical protein
MQPGETLRADIRREQRDKILMIARHRGSVVRSSSTEGLPPGREMLVLLKKEPT